MSQYEGLCGCWVDDRHSGLSKTWVCGGMFPSSVPASSFQEASSPAQLLYHISISEHPDLSKQEVAAI